MAKRKTSSIIHIDSRPMNPAVAWVLRQITLPHTILGIRSPNGWNGIIATASIIGIIILLVS